MKKRTMKERKEAFKKAYYEELKKQGVIDPVEETTEQVEEVTEENENIIAVTSGTYEDMTKAELIEVANKLELKTNTHMTKAELINLINDNTIDEKEVEE